MIITAPWTEEQVRALNKYQHAGVMHPFTCGNDHPGTTQDDRILEATVDGWICPIKFCYFEQDWCHDFMINIGLDLEAKELSMDEINKIVIRSKPDGSTS